METEQVLVQVAARSTPYLWGDIQDCAKLLEEALGGGTEVSCAKVNHPDAGCLVTAGHQDVFRLEVPVGDALAVHERKEVHEAPHDLGNLLFSQLLHTHRGSVWTAVVGVDHSACALG